MKHRIVLTGLALAAALSAPLATTPLTASAQMYGGANAGMMQDRHHVMGRVASFSGYDLRLDNGRRVQLHQGTVINPTGWSIRPGQRVSVTGSWVQGRFQADRINVVRRGRG
jgi:hypothetical protein